MTILQVAVDRAIIGAESGNAGLLSNKINATPCVGLEGESPHPRDALLATCLEPSTADHACCQTMLALGVVLGSIGTVHTQYGDDVSSCAVPLVDVVNATLDAMFAFPNASRAVQLMLADYHRSGVFAPHAVHVTPMSTESYDTTFFWDYAAQTLAIFFVLSYVFPTFRLIRGLVYEKESGVREGLRMMGMAESALVLSWLITYTVQFTIVALGLTVLTCFPILGAKRGNLFVHSSPLIIFVFYWLFGVATTCFCYFVHVFFSRSRTAATLGAVFWLAAFFPYFAVNRTHTTVSRLWKLVASLLPPTAIGLGLDTTSVLESSGAGVTFETLWIECVVLTCERTKQIDLFCFTARAHHAAAVRPCAGVRGRQCAHPPVLQRPPTNANLSVSSQVLQLLLRLRPCLPHPRLLSLPRRSVVPRPRLAARPRPGEFSFMYRYILRESCSQFDALPLTSLTISRLASRPRPAPRPVVLLPPIVLGLQEVRALRGGE